MIDRLGPRLEHLADRLPDGQPDLASVVERGKRTKMLRIGASTLGAIGILAAITFAVLNVDLTTSGKVAPATHDDVRFVPAQPGEPTYVLTDFQIEYPWAAVDGLPNMEQGSERRKQYCSMPERNEACESEGNAGFLYEWHWSTDQFPGVVACRAELFSHDGRQVGQADWELSGLEPSSRRPSSMLVHVSGEPERAEATCEAGSYEGGAGYEATLVDIESLTPTESVLTFEIEHLTEHAPDARTCTLRVTLESGEQNPDATFNLTTPERAITLRAPHPAGDGVDDASLTCEVYTVPAGDDCPELLPSRGPEARRSALQTADDWARQHRPGPPKTRFRVDVARAKGDPLSPCRKFGQDGAMSWRRTWVANIDWRYPKGSGLDRSASMSSSTVLIGRTALGWLVYSQFH